MGKGKDKRRKIEKLLKKLRELETARQQGATGAEDNTSLISPSEQDILYEKLSAFLASYLKIPSLETESGRTKRRKIAEMAFAIQEEGDGLLEEAEKITEEEEMKAIEEVERTLEEAVGLSSKSDTSDQKEEKEFSLETLLTLPPRNLQKILEGFMLSYIASGLQEFQSDSSVIESPNYSEGGLWENLSGMISQTTSLLATDRGERGLVKPEETTSFQIEKRLLELFAAAYQYFNPAAVGSEKGSFGLPIILMGEAGIGKTSCAKQAALLLNLFNHVIEMNAVSSSAITGYDAIQEGAENTPLQVALREGLISEEDARELGDYLESFAKKTNITIKALPDWVKTLLVIKRAAERSGRSDVGAMVIFDEMDKAPTEALVALANIISTKKVGYDSLPPHTFFVGIANPETSTTAGMGLTPLEYPSNLINRMSVIKLDSYPDMGEEEDEEETSSFKSRQKILKSEKGRRGVTLKDALLEIVQTYATQENTSVMGRILCDVMGEGNFKEYLTRLSTPIVPSSDRWQKAHRLGVGLVFLYLNRVLRGGGRIPISPEDPMKDRLMDIGEEAGETVRGFEEIYSPESLSTRIEGGKEGIPYRSFRTFVMAQNILATCFYYNIHPSVRNALIEGVLDVSTAKDFIKFMASILKPENINRIIEHSAKARRERKSPASLGEGGVKGAFWRK